MELSHVDNLRLNVLLSQQPQAVRINESRMTVQALTGRGEATVRLNPTCRDERYLRLVREFLSAHYLGSPGGYPVYLRRWTRMGQARDESLERLLLLGEPEAVSAVAHAPGLTNRLAQRAWWASPTPENARRMLERKAVAGATMGPELATFLVDYLPFEEEPQAMIDTIRLVLQPGLISKQQIQELWTRGRRKSTYLVGFLQALPDNLPDTGPAHAQFQSVVADLQRLVAANNIYAQQLCRVLSGGGQAFLHTAKFIFGKAVNQDVVVALLDVIGSYFRQVRPDAMRRVEISEVLHDARVVCGMADGDMAAARSEQVSAVHQVIAHAPQWRPQVCAMVTLSLIDQAVVRQIFGRTDAVGSVMRSRLAPITGPVFDQFSQLSDRGG